LRKDGGVEFHDGALPLDKLPGRCESTDTAWARNARERSNRKRDGRRDYSVALFKAR
jgi:hypothetical protein